MLKRSIIIGISRDSVPTRIPVEPVINYLAIEPRFIDGKIVPRIDIIHRELTPEQKAIVEQIKELRSATGCGMMDCKKALYAVDGDFEKAIEYLRNRRICHI